MLILWLTLFGYRFLLHLRKYKHEIWLQFSCHQKPQRDGECHGKHACFCQLVCLSRNRTNKNMSFLTVQRDGSMIIHSVLTERVKRQGNTDSVMLLSDSNKALCRITSCFLVEWPWRVCKPTKRTHFGKLAITRSISRSRSLRESETPAIYTCPGKFSHYLR